MKPRKNEQGKPNCINQKSNKKKSRQEKNINDIFDIYFPVNKEMKKIEIK